jgi:MFS family permease
VFGLFLAAGTLTWVIQLHDMKYVLVLIGLLGLSYGIVLPAWNSVLATAVPRHQRGGMMGFFMTVEALGMTVGPAFGGLLVSFGQVMSLAFYVAAGLLALMGVLYLFLRIDLIRVEEAAT